MGPTNLIKIIAGDQSWTLPLSIVTSRIPYLKIALESKAVLAMGAKKEFELPDDCDAESFGSVLDWILGGRNLCGGHGYVKEGVKTKTFTPPSSDEDAEDLDEEVDFVFHDREGIAEETEETGGKEANWQLRLLRLYFLSKKFQLNDLVCDTVEQFRTCLGHTSSFLLPSSINYLVKALAAQAQEEEFDLGYDQMKELFLELAVDTFLKRDGGDKGLGQWLKITGGGTDEGFRGEVMKELKRHVGRSGAGRCKVRGCVVHDNFGGAWCGGRRNRERERERERSMSPVRPRSREREVW